MENIQWRIILKTGKEIDVNVKAPTIFAAADEILQSIAAGDLRVKAEDVRQIVDIPG